jgi:tellurite resistance protein TerB
VALAAMMYLVATEDGPLTPVQEQRILSELTSRVGLGPDLARTCLTGGRRLARGVHGDLNSRLHQLVPPIEAQCSLEEKRDVIDMLHLVAGANADRIGSVREGLGRLSSSLLRG